MMIENTVVRELLKKLKNFRESVSSLNKSGLVHSSLIPPSVREEAAKVYLEHGGLDILMEVLHVSADQIREWTRNIKSNPNYYIKKGRKGIVTGLLGDMKLPAKRKREQGKTRKNIMNVLSGNLEKKCNELKAEIEICKDKNRGAVSLQLKKRVAELIHEAGNPKPIAILLGISYKVVAGWKYLYTETPELDIVEISD